MLPGAGHDLLFLDGQSLPLEQVLRGSGPFNGFKSTQFKVIHFQINLGDGSQL